MSKPNRIDGVEWIHLFNGDRFHVPSEITRLGGTLTTIPNPPKPKRLINVDWIHRTDGYQIELSKFKSSTGTPSGADKPCRLINVDYIFDHHGNELGLSLYRPAYGASGSEVIFAGGAGNVYT